MQTIQKWIQSRGGWTHASASAYAFLVLAYATVPTFHTLVLSIFHATPAWAHESILALGGLIALYKSTANPTKE